MKRIFRSVQLFALMLVAGSSFCFTACSDDDIQNPNEITTETMFGDYQGKVTTWNVAAVEGEDNEEETASGIDISATIKNDTIHLEKFPIKDIVLSIIKDETLADKIVEAVGDVNYNIGYVPTLAVEKDSIMMNLNPESLKLAVKMPAENESEEVQALVVEVQIEAGEEAGYAVENGNVKFYFAATKVMLGEGENQQELPDFVPTTFQFDMNQCKVAHNF